MIDIDSILLEWSVRCEKGYPDINNSADWQILNEIMAEKNYSLSEIISSPESNHLVNEDAIAQDEDAIEQGTLADMLAKGKFSPKTLNRIRALVTRSVDTETFVEQFLNEHVPNKDKQYIDDIMDLMLDSGVKVETLKSYLKNRTIKYTEFVNKPTSIADKFKQTGLSTKSIESLSSFVKKGVGPFEWLLAIVLSGASRPATGDLKIDGKSFEIKAFKGRILPFNGLADAATARSSFINSYTSLKDQIPESSREQWYEIADRIKDAKLWSSGQILNTLNFLHEEFMKLSTPDINKLDAIANALKDSLTGYYTLGNVDLSWTSNVLNTNGTLKRKEFIIEWATVSFDYYIKQTDSKVENFIVTNSGTGDNRKSYASVQILIFPVKDFKKHVGTNIGLDIPSFSDTAGQANAFGLKLGSRTAVLQ